MLSLEGLSHLNQLAMQVVLYPNSKVLGLALSTPRELTCLKECGIKSRRIIVASLARDCAAQSPQFTTLQSRKAGWFELFLGIPVLPLRVKLHVRHATIYPQSDLCPNSRPNDLVLILSYVVDGTHPHQWSPRKEFNIYPFQSKDATHALPLLPEATCVENFITHNGDFEFYRFGNGKYYDTSEVQQFLVKALGVEMPATVDSAAVAGMIDLLRCQGSWALSLRCAVCFATDSIDPADKHAEYPSTQEYVEVGKLFEKSLHDFVINHQIKCAEDISSSFEKRSQLVDCIMGPYSTHFASSKTGCINKFVSSDEEAGSHARFIRSVVDAFFDNDLLHTTRTFLENAKGSFGLSVSSTLDAHRQGENCLMQSTSASMFITLSNNFVFQFASLQKDKPYLWLSIQEKASFATARNKLQ